jgi:Holliday junction resolvase YEN1
MWRILHFMKYNIQLIWVFDGPRRPWNRNKRGGGGRPQDERERTQLLCQLLDHLKVPHHHAPAEAEAECARMQQSGIVDAVWSDDGDTLMFGATSMISAHKVEKNR